MKKISILSLLLVFALVFTGCTSNEMAIYNAFEKSQDITSMESNTDVTFTVDVEGLSPEDQQGFQQMQTMVKDSKVSLHQKMVQNKEKTAATAQVDMNMNFGGMAMNFPIWVDTDMTGKTPKLVEIIKMPAMMKMGLPQELQTKEYAVINFEEMMKDQKEKQDFANMMKFAQESQGKFATFFKDYVKNFDPGFTMVEKKGTKVIDGESLDIYELKLDDASFKKLVRYTGNSFMDNKDTMKFVKEYMDMVMTFSQATNPQAQLDKAELNKGLAELEKNLPEMKKEFNKFMDQYNNVKFIGDKGIVIEYGINKDGYIVHENGKIDLHIDMAAIEKVAAKVEKPQAKGIFNIGINYNSKIYNINKDVKVDMPKLTPQNSMSLTQMMEAQAKMMETQIVQEQNIQPAM
ncbi:hypothetical protein [Inediibacterium massiliense]|uniref:hypothetical protein n=1 Tax=Inediibacterium massiliense TaxID=1658111 RepID=UPI0006B5DE56|nr:hypothetical protein [Inediibacterium massiliense]